MVMTLPSSQRELRDFEAVYAKLSKVFEMIEYLKTSPRSTKELAVRFDMNRRTTYRYLQLIEAIGFSLERQIGRYGKYFIIFDVCPRPMCE